VAGDRGGVAQHRPGVSQHGSGADPSAGASTLATATLLGQRTSTLLFSPNRNHYHSLVDNLARLCGLGLPPLASTQVKAVYHGPLTAVERYVLDRIRPPNVALELLGSQALVRAETLVLPTFPAWRYSGWLPRWYLDQLRTALLPTGLPVDRNGCTSCGGAIAE